jgi:hypothetical protein
MFLDNQQDQSLMFPNSTSYFMPRDFLPRLEAVRATGEMQKENDMSQLQIDRVDYSAYIHTYIHTPSTSSTPYRICHFRPIFRHSHSIIRIINILESIRMVFVMPFQHVRKRGFDLKLVFLNRKQGTSKVLVGVLIIFLGHESTSSKHAGGIITGILFDGTKIDMGRRHAGVFDIARKHMTG